MEDGSFIRIRNITLNYAIPKNIVSRLKMSSLNVFVSADNPFTFTKFSGLDPETNSFSNTNYFNIPGVSHFKYPISKQYLFGVQFQF